MPKLLQLSFLFSGRLGRGRVDSIPQNNLYSYNVIADSLRKSHISENREKITVQRFYGSKKMENHLQTEKDVKFVSEMVLTQCINSLKIAIIIYRCIKKIQLV
jgi:hypothetical protein